MTSIYRAIARYNDTNSGLGWTVSSYIEKADPVAVKTAFNLWNTKYMDLCAGTIVPNDLRVSDVDVWGDMTVYALADITTKIGQAAGAVMPMAECILLIGNAENTFAQKTSRWHLHGLATSFFNTEGDLDTTDATVQALATASFPWLLNYRKTASPVHGLPVITPPQEFDTMRAAGPYVRRLGNPFFLAGQRARYTRT